MYLRTKNNAEEQELAPQDAVGSITEQHLKLKLKRHLTVPLSEENTS